MGKSFMTTKLLGLDSESTGMAFSGKVDPKCPDPTTDIISGKQYTAISWGLVVVDMETLSIIDELYVEIKHTAPYAWEYGAEKVHGLTREHLAEHGKSREDAAVEIAEFILKHWDIESAISTIGHNQVTFDHWFFRQLKNEFGIMFKFANRHIDTNYLTLGVYGVEGSKELFELFSDARGTHNALEDIKQTVEVFVKTRKLFDEILGK